MHGANAYPQQVKIIIIKNTHYNALKIKCSQSRCLPALFIQQMEFRWCKHEKMPLRVAKRYEHYWKANNSHGSEGSIICMHYLAFISTRN
jgi:hypothetical protein